ncbi:MAG TPA: hypothetical protein VHN12_00010 [Geobacteraceae bacterium]|nr:hypothetical protein [Geobacteraceae bacterium]
MRTMALFLAFMGLAAGAWASSVGEAVEVRIISDNGSELPFYPVAASLPSRKVYAEAARGNHYTIAVRNRLDRRVGVVVAVDGRNIISGKKSRLRDNERMYILEPYGVGEFKGWRTGDDRINRFYFTSVADSYAAAFNDESAMGVIAVAVYPEMQRREVPAEISMARPAMPSAAGKSESKRTLEAKEDNAGTGFGREEYSPVLVVAFQPEHTALEKIYIKYEWRNTLCRKEVIACGKPLPRPYNRMWRDDGTTGTPRTPPGIDPKRKYGG